MAKLIYLTLLKYPVPDSYPEKFLRNHAIPVNNWQLKNGVITVVHE